MKKKNSKKFYFIKTIFFATIFISGAGASGIAASPLLKRITASPYNFPKVDLLVTLARPDPSENWDTEKLQFTIEELAQKKDKQAEILSVDPVELEASSLNLLFMLDTTLSVKRKDFTKMQEDVETLTSLLKKNDHSALYKFNSRASVVSGLSNQTDILTERLKAAKQDGKVTRIYDSLFKTIESASVISQTSLSNDPLSRTALFLFTDGHDEGSFLTDDDCTMLSIHGQRNGIPIYIILYGKANNQHLFRRVAMRTGGAVLTSPSKDELEKFVNHARTLSDYTYRIRYVSPDSSRWSLTKKNTHVILTFKHGSYQDKAEFDYSISLIDILKHKTAHLNSERLWMLLIILGTLLLLLLLVLWFLRYSKKQNKQRETHNETTSSSYNTSMSQNYISRKSDDLYVHKNVGRNETDAQNISSKVDAKIQTMPAAESSTGESEEIPRYITPFRGLPWLQNYTNFIKRKHESEAFIRDSSLRNLQDALNNAARYRRGYIELKEDRVPLKKMEIVSEVTAIGRGRYANFYFDDPSIDPIHLKIKRVKDCFVVYNTSSGSRSYLNGKKILRPRSLHDGDELKLGKTTLYFRGEYAKDE